MSWLSCKKFCERASQRADGALSPRERTGYWAHFFICFTCRRFERQIKRIERIFHCLREKGLDQASECCLDENAKSRMKSMLVERKHQ